MDSEISEMMKLKLEEFAKIMNEIAGSESDFSITKIPNGFCVWMTGNFILSKIKGVSYPWYAILSKKVWAESNLKFIAAVIRDIKIAEEIPEAWTTLYENIPRKYASVGIDFQAKVEA